MNESRVRLITGLLAAAVLGAGCRTSPRVHDADAANTTPIDPRQAAVERVRADSLRHPYTMADIHFMSSMIGHHGQAIAMSRLAPNNGASASIRTLGERIINAQQDEIAIMRQWLRDRGQPAPDTQAAAMAHHAHDAMPMESTRMPGMLTPAQMQQLEAAKGPEFDRLFLTYMIQHHRGALDMVRDLFGTPGAAQDLTVFKVANEVNVDQTTEINRMAQMLAPLIFERPPA